jgi:hypothetical protein
MYNDSTTVSRIKATVDSNISKRSDKNHTRKGFRSSLYELSNTHKAWKNNKLGNILKSVSFTALAKTEINLKN